MAPVVQEDLKVCRVCLALDVKMYNMNDFKLSEMFQNITGITAIDKKGGILQRICWECAARLTAAAAFREKALLSDALLNDQVHIKESDIDLIKQNYSSLKSPLCVTTNEPTMLENKEIDNIFIPNDKTAINERKTNIRINEKGIEFEEYEPWIDVHVKTEVESDPIAVKNMRFHDGKGDKYFEHFNTSLREDSEDDTTNTEVQINHHDKIFRGDTENKVPYINDDNIYSVEDNEPVDKKPKLDGLGNIVYEPSSEEDRHSEEASFNKYQQNMSSKVGITKESATISRNRRVSFNQLETLWEIVNDNRALATGYNKTSQAREYSKRMWQTAADSLNSQGDGAKKDWKAWCKYWNDYKSKLKCKVASARASLHRTGGGPYSEGRLSDLELKFLQILGEDFGAGLPGFRVEGVEPSFNIPTEDRTEAGSAPLLSAHSGQSEGIMAHSLTMETVLDTRILVIPPEPTVAASSPPATSLATTPPPPPPQTPPPPLVPTVTPRSSSTLRRTQRRWQRQRRMGPMSAATTRHARGIMSEGRARLDKRRNQILENIALELGDIKGILNTRLPGLPTADEQV